MIMIIIIYQQMLTLCKKYFSIFQQDQKIHKNGFIYHALEIIRCNPLSLLLQLASFMT